MFTGLIEELGIIRSMQQTGNTMVLSIACKQVLEDTVIGDSIAVNGVCLTVTMMGTDYFTADVMPETMQRTQLHTLKQGNHVNLERAMALGSRMGGHMVQGHIDGTATLSERRVLENAELFRFHASATLTRYMIEKGSIAINGVSLTLVDVTPDFFSVSLIPHSLQNTQFQYLTKGDSVNIETDLVGKYIAKLITTTPENQSSTLTMKKVQEAGFFS